MSDINLPLFNIDDFAEKAREFVLTKNLRIPSVSENNGYSSFKQSLGSRTVINDGTNNVKDLNKTNEQNQGLYRDLNTTNNIYKPDNGYDNINISLREYKNSKSGVYRGSVDEDDENSTNQGLYRDLNTINNKYFDAEAQTKININLNPTVGRGNGTYIDETGNIQNGGPSTQPIDIIGGALNGSLGITNNGIDSNFNLRNTIAGRTLTGLGVIDDTPIGIIGAEQYGLAMLNNAAFNLQEETTGRLNLNPLSLLKGNDIIVPNYDITVPQGKLQKVLNFGAKLAGFEIPVSLMSESSSLFSRDDSGIGRSISNIQRNNSIIANTGRGQVINLFSNLRRNLYQPAYSDERDNDDGLNSLLYTHNDGTGEVIDVLNVNLGKLPPNNYKNYEGDINSPITDSNVTTTAKREKLPSLKTPAAYVNDDSLQEDGGDNPFITKFSWGSKDNKNNSIAEKYNFNDIFKQSTNPRDLTERSLLYKTQQLFKSNKIKTIISNRSGIVTDDNSEIQSSVQFFSTDGNGDDSSPNFHISRGSGVKNADGTYYCRSWTTFYRYDQLKDLQKNDSIYTRGLNFRLKNTQESVLDDNGMVKVSPYSREIDGNPKRYMFSLENLAWADDTNLLPQCEVGNGDPESGLKGRIMWFPPYGLSITDNTSVNLDSTNFIGRGEPVYTYNNTERTGTLQFKIVVDHASILNDLRKTKSNDELISFFSGCLDEDDFDLVKQKLSEEEKTQIIVENTEEKTRRTSNKQGTLKFSLYYPNDGTYVDTNYENGLTSDGDFIDYTTNTNGEGEGEGLTDSEEFTEGITEYYVDNTNYGLNVDFKYITGDVNLEGHPKLNSEVASKKSIVEFITEECKACRVKVTGYASPDGNPISNQKLSEKRAQIALNEIKKYVDLAILESEEEIVVKYDKPVAGGEDSSAGFSESITDVDNPKAKSARRATVEFEYDASLEPEITIPKQIKKEVPRKLTETELNDAIGRRFINECAYFEKLEQTDRFVFDNVKDKLKYFHPAFHSTTPEGLNSRLTFLHQCTRQGPTKEGSNDITPDNLAFGRPPVLIMRIGDFYHTKIMLDSMNISFENDLWDLNPEGIGVQPMIANIDISFKYLGGSSMVGPINRLQNALSFNYYANTEIYDRRSDYYERSKSDDGKEDVKLKRGWPYDEVNNQLKEQLGVESDTNNTNEPRPVDDVKRIEDENLKAQDDVDKEDNPETTEPVITGFRVIDNGETLNGDYNILLSIQCENCSTEEQQQELIEQGIKLTIKNNPDLSQFQTNEGVGGGIGIQNNLITTPTTQLNKQYQQVIDNPIVFTENLALGDTTTTVGAITFPVISKGDLIKGSNEFKLEYNGTRKTFNQII